MLTLFQVLNTNDAGAGSLRQAILDANNDTGTTTIGFQIPGSGVHTIRPLSPLPALTRPVSVDGFTQTGYAGAPLIELNGNSAGASADGLTILAVNSAVKGLIVNGFGGAGIVVNGASGNAIVGNYIGTNATGMAAAGNNTGIRLVNSMNNTIGGTTAQDRNLISGNLQYGVFAYTFLTVAGNRFEGNYIGTDVLGTHPLANRVGIQFEEPDIIGGTTAAARNLISGNDIGVVFSASYYGQALIEGNYIGTDVTGTTALANRIGIQVDGSLYSAQGCVIGGTTVAARNVISGNSFAGVEVSGSGAVANGVLGNYIGTDAGGTRAVGNGYGVLFSGGTSYDGVGATVPGTGNVISGNAVGIVVLSATGTLIQGNYIGTAFNGSGALPNVDGIELLAGDTNLVGGTIAAAANVIAGNANTGVLVTSGGNQIQGNHIGLDALGSVLPNSEGIFVSGPNNEIGRTATGAGNVISGNTTAGVDLSGALATGNRVEGNRIGTNVAGTSAVPNGRGVMVSGSNNTIGGTAAGARNVISGNVTDGIYIPGNANLVLGNYIGSDAAGSAVLANKQGYGVNVTGSNNTIGDATGAGRNLISGNSFAGAYVAGSGNIVQGNYIGTDATGTQKVPNQGNGVDVASIAKSAVIGGTAAGAGNVVSGNGNDGLVVDATGALIQGNLIGTDAAGTAALANGLAGIHVISGSGNTIGGTTTAARNVISGNAQDGVKIEAASSNDIEGNYIGTDVTGSMALPNGGSGIVIPSNSSNTQVGGTAAGSGNLIAGNTGSGITLQGGGNTVEGNWIGTDRAGSLALGNHGNGVAVLGGSNNIVGGTTTAAGNTIEFNGQDGIRVDTGMGNAIRGNAILGHQGGLGIELTNNGNHNQAFPVLTSAMADASGTTITGTLASAPNTTFTVEFFADRVCNPSGYGEGARFLDSTPVTTDASGNAAFVVTVALAVNPGQYITATATDPANNTSAFSACVTVTLPAVPGAPVLATGAPAVPVSRVGQRPASTAETGIGDTTGNRGHSANLFAPTGEYPLVDEFLAESHHHGVIHREDHYRGSPNGGLADEDGTIVAKMVVPLIDVWGETTG